MQVFRCKSNVKKLMDPPSEDRLIADFPPPFNENCTPYPLDYRGSTRSICLNNNKLVTSTLKICKAIILGDVSVGKTCIVNRFCNKTFESNYKATIGVDFEVERFDILSIPFNLQIWDTAGQERFKSIAQSYYRAAKVIIIVFDVSCIYSLSNSKVWYRDVMKSCSEEPFVFLVGTKKDLVSPAAYEHVEKAALKVAKQLKAEYWAVSAKTGENIQKFFFRVAALAFDDILSEENEKIIVNIGSELVSFKNNEKMQGKKHGCNDVQCLLL